MIEEQWNSKHRMTFVARQRDMQTVMAALLKDRRRLVHLVGAAGIGKTEFVRHLAETNGHEFPGGTLFLSQPTNEKELTELRRMLAERDQDLLLVLDGIDEGPLPIKMLIGYLRGLTSMPNVNVLSTSRPIELPREFAPFHRLELSAFDQSEAEELVQRISFLYGDIPPKFIDLAAGSPLVLLRIAEVAHARGGYHEALEALSSFSRPGLLGPNGQPLSRQSDGARTILTSVDDVNRKLLLHIRANPNEVFEISPRQYEEVTAELFSELGYDVTLTPKSKDGGKDILIAKKDALGSFLFYVECKRYAPDRPVGVEVVNALSGVVERGRATAGIVMTTSRFTKGAREAERELQHRLALKDYSDWKEMLDKFPAR